VSQLARVAGTRALVTFVYLRMVLSGAFEGALARGETSEIQPIKWEILTTFDVHFVIAVGLRTIIDIVVADMHLYRRSKPNNRSDVLLVEDWCIATQSKLGETPNNADARTHT
jgi:hypothetical protein